MIYKLINNTLQTHGLDDEKDGSIKLGRLGGLDDEN